MKKIISFLLLMMAVCLGSFSCYEDKSTLDESPITLMTIDTTGMGGAIRIGYQEQLVITPNYSGRDVSDYEFEWTLTDTYMTSTAVLSTEQNLETTISAAISTSSYYLCLTLTDKTNSDLEQFITWDLYVESSFGEGLLVCDSKDGITSDITLIMDYDLTADLTSSPSRTEDILMTGYGQAINGKVRQIQYAYDGSYYGTRYNRVFVTTEDGGLYKYDTEDYSLLSSTESDLILYKPIGFEAYGMAASSTKSVLMTSVGLYFLSYTLSTNSTFSSTDTSSVPSNNLISNDSYSSADTPVLIWYSEDEGLFYAYRSAWTTPTIGTYSSDETTPFNPGDYPDSETIAAGLSVDDETHTFIMRDKTSGDYSLLTFARDYYDDDWNYYYSAASSYKAIPDNVAAILDKAVSVFFCRTNAIAYIVTETEIYAMLFSGSDITFDSTPKYTVASGETITSAELYMQGVYRMNKASMPDYYTELPLNNKAVVITTQKSEYDGTVYIIPQKDAGTGNLDADSELVYSGFGAIQGVTFTAR